MIDNLPCAKKFFTRQSEVEIYKVSFCNHRCQLCSYPLAGNPTQTQNEFGSRSVIDVGSVPVVISIRRLLSQSHTRRSARSSMDCKLPLSRHGPQACWTAWLDEICKTLKRNADRQGNSKDLDIFSGFESDERKRH